ncbi:unnamed protein product [Leptosia nina]|uniref:KOW domain-containing protein n=1 Tax=Leptosia nina TaxID=320188 RepID=A0AAV1J1E7_9NEOP
MEPKKISFGFMKTKKQDKPVIVEKKDFIECVEEKAIKVVGGDIIEEKTPLVIPMKPNTLMTAERLKQIAEKVENFEEEDKKLDTESTNKVDPKNETLEEMAARELLEEAKKKEIVDVAKLVVPIPMLPVIDGQKESTMDDYDSVPIQDFGMAMLRGMGWTPGKEMSKYKQPQLRPKGLGLGADKVVKENQKKKTAKENEEELSIIKKAYVRITTGKYAGFYGQVVSLDEENGRAMVEIPIKKETVSLSEFMMQPVPKSEYDKQSKVINADSYEEYKKNESSQKAPNPRPKPEKDSSSGQRYNEKRKGNEEHHSNGSRLKKRNDSPDLDKERRRNKSSKRYSSSDSLNSSESDYRSRRRSYSSDSDREKRSHKKSSKGKRDIDKKRKGKKKKRDRDRSPNYKKYRK